MRVRCEKGATNENFSKEKLGTRREPSGKMNVMVKEVSINHGAKKGSYDRNYPWG